MPSKQSLICFPSLPLVTGTSISCYFCNSRNRTQASCHDPIHPEGTAYIEHCKVPKEDHNGLFPAYYCIKMIGVSQVSGEEVVVRYCSMENMDNQCGNFKFMEEPFEGCILTCNYDGCNHSANSSRVAILLTFSSTLVTIFFSFASLSVG